jgi:hypothetical protein
MISIGCRDADLVLGPVAYSVSGAQARRTHASRECFVRRQSRARLPSSNRAVSILQLWYILVACMSIIDLH